MTKPPEFRLLEIASLSVHEEIDPVQVERLAREIERQGVVREPIWVAEGSHVILNGHHRFTALKKIGAVRVPAWVVSYDDPRVELDRWSPGPVLTKAEVIERARSARPFPPKTTKHSLPSEVPPHPTPLSELLPEGRRRAPRGAQ
ncbi:MAG: ParB N-terminal domain-containing protein [Thermoplasmata archaeon]|nr:ParB N-terminal domain-containing protein [Thermoplasmata archaeon]